MKIGIVGTGSVRCACAIAAVNRGSGREIVLLNRTRKSAEAVATDSNGGLGSLTKRADRFAKNVVPVIREIQSSGVAPHRAIARSLNARGVATARGGQWTAVQVGSILRRVVTDVPC